jgi:hypothetical protein
VLRSSSSSAGVCVIQHDLPVLDGHRANRYDAVGLRVESGRFGIEHDENEPPSIGVSSVHVDSNDCRYRARKGGVVTGL